MGDKFIPNADADFALMAGAFAKSIARDPARLAVVQADSDALSEAVARFEQAVVPCRAGASRSQATTREKNLARKEAERQIRRLARLIRVNESIDVATKFSLGLRQRRAKANSQACPKEPPRLRFVRALHEGSGSWPMHELEFRTAQTFSGAKPAGAVRVELFVDLISPGEPIPAWPGANHGGRPWYLRSFTRNPIVIVPPMARVPMQVVYWARWADSTGNVGAFSTTAVAVIEGGSYQRTLALSMDSQKPAPLLEDATRIGPAGREQTISIAILDAQYESLNPQSIALQATAALPATPDRQRRQLEGPPAENEERVEASEAA